MDAMMNGGMKEVLMAMGILTRLEKNCSPFYL